MAAEDFYTRFWDLVCENEYLAKAGLAVTFALLALQALTSPAVEPGTASYIIMIVNFALLIPVSLFMIWVLRRCATREPAERF